MKAIWDIGKNSGGKVVQAKTLGWYETLAKLRGKSCTIESWGAICDIDKNLGEKSDTSKSGGSNMRL